MENNLDHYLKTWHLSDPQPLATTATSHLYTVMTEGEQERLVLKLLTAYGHEEKVGAIALDYWKGHGAVRMLCYDDQAQLMEYADGDSLDPLVKAGQDEQATEIIAGVIAQLHSLTGDSPAGLYPLKRWFRFLFQQAEKEQDKGTDSVFVRGARVAEELLNDPRDVRVLHGDILQHYNIRQSARGWLAFDPKGLVGERTYDCANTLCNPVMPELVHDERRLLTNAGILADMLVLDLWRVLAFTYAYACLNASWWLQLGGDDIVAWALKVAQIVEPHVEP